MKTDHATNIDPTKNIIPGYTLTYVIGGITYHGIVDSITWIPGTPGTGILTVIGDPLIGTIQTLSYGYSVNATQGDYIMTSGTGMMLKIVAVIVQVSPPSPTDTVVRCTVEDYNRTNIMQSDSGSGGIPDGEGFLFSVVDGMPIIHPIPDALAGSLPYYFAVDVLNRFLNDKTYKEIEVNQVAHGFVVGDSLYLDATGWHKATADTVANGRVMGIVTQTGVPGPDRFRLKPNGGIPVTGISMPVGPNGDIVYLAADGSMSLDKPTTGVIVPLFIKLSATSGIYIGGQNTGPVTAADVSFDNTTAGISNNPTTVQEAINELAKGTPGMIDGIPFSEGTAGPPMVARDSAGTGIDLSDAAAFERSAVQDIVFRVPSGYNNGVVLAARYLINGAVPSGNVKLRLNYSVVDAGGTAEGGTLYTQNLSLALPLAQDTVTATDIFTIPGSEVTDASSWISCRLTRRGSDVGDGYPGEWCLLSLTLKKL